MRNPRRSIRGFVVSVLFALPGFVLAEGLLAQNPSSRSVGYRGAHSNQLSSRSVSRPRQPSRLLPPAGLGSATNAPPGFYNRHLGVPPSHHHAAPGPVRAPVYVPYPYPVYVNPPEYAVSPSEVGAAPQTLLPEDAYPREPSPQPIYVIQAPPPPAAPPAPAYTPPPAPKPSTPRSTEPAPVRFTVQPPDAEIYLDEEFLGTGAQLSGRDQPLLLRPGVYVLEVTHPELRGQRLVFGFRSEEVTDVRVDLAESRPRQRSRIR